MQQDVRVHPRIRLGTVLWRKQKRFVELERPSKVEEISGKGIRAQMKLGEVLCGNRALLEMHHVNVQMMESDVYGTEVFVAINGELAGYLVIADTLKEDSVSAIRKMKNTDFEQQCLQEMPKQVQMP